MTTHTANDDRKRRALEPSTPTGRLTQRELVLLSLLRRPDDLGKPRRA